MRRVYQLSEIGKHLLHPGLCFFLFVSSSPVHQTQKLPDFLVEILSISSMQIAKSRRFNLMQFVHTVSVCGWVIVNSIRPAPAMSAASLIQRNHSLILPVSAARLTGPPPTAYHKYVNIVHRLSTNNPPPNPPTHSHPSITCGVCVCVFVSGH